MKNIILSFDDARKDFFTRAYPLLKKYNIKATLNVTSGFILHPDKFSQFSSGGNKSMTSNDILECQNNGIEIALHGSMHLNTKEDVLRNIRELQEMGLKTENIGFASPSSCLTFENKNDDGIWDLVNKGVISYIRSGIQIRREGYVYMFFSLLDSLIHSKKIFWYLNKRNIIVDTKIPFLSSVAIYSYTSLKQIQNLITSMPDNSSVILMFHSILKKTDIGYGNDKWYWDEILFRNLLDFLYNEKEVRICTSYDLVSHNKNK